MNIFEILMPLTVFAGIALVIKVITDAFTRNKLINKGLVDENVKFLFPRYSKNAAMSNIKWGLVLVGIGAAIFIYELSDISENALIGLMFLFAGAAFLIYYPMAKKEEEKEIHQISDSNQ